MNTKNCPECGSTASMKMTDCGVYVCHVCDFHEGIVRCFCGWSLSGGNGREELAEMGETLEPDDWFDFD